ncbi:MAG: DUF975 family protein [Oscillospiraceae bacterium]|nr:DUF975 family protein [Oscillospiraceae bacterium]
MDIKNRRAIQNTAAEALACVSDSRTVALIYGGGTALLALLCTIVTYVVGIQIRGTGGLGNMGLRSVLSTVQFVLPLAQSLIVVFLGFGYQSAALRMARRVNCRPDVLLDGFRRFGPLVRLSIAQSIIYMAIAFLALYVGAQVFVMTPLAKDFLEIMMPLISSATVLTDEIVLDEATLLAATEAMLPMIPIVLILFLIAALPIAYQYRMSTFALLDDPGRGAFAAMRESRSMMKGNRVDLFKIDVSFWWFYLTELVIGLIAYADVLLPRLGVSFPWSDTVSYFLFYVVSLALQTGLYYLFLNRVHVTYAAAYETLRAKPEQTRVPLGNIFNL